MSEKFSWLNALKEARPAAAGALMLRQALACHSLQGFELELIGRWLATVGSNADLEPLRVAVLSGYATQPLANAVRVAALREGFLAAVYEAPFGAVRAEILSPDSGLYRFAPDVVLLDIGVPALEYLPRQPLDEAQIAEALTAEIAAIRLLWETLEDLLGAPIIQQTLVAPAATPAGVAERTAPWSAITFLEQLNARLIADAPASVRWLDVDRLSRTIGLANWYDPRLVHHAKFGFATTCLPSYEAWLGAALRTVLARAPKALIVDLDNTLWGGVIGDDGLDGIRLGPDSAEGAAYQAFCRYIQGLGQRGVILGICSKNDIANVREVFDRHPHMPLRLTEIAAIRCNWEDKASNLQSLAAELNIDPAALVFVDDNPAECEIVRQHLPQVRVLQLEGDPAAFVGRLDALCLFHAQGFSSEDLGRTNSYRARAQSEELKRSVGDLDSYLRSLQMRACIEVADERHLSRLAQMEGKTNQFNLSTRRLDEAALRAMATSTSHIVLCLSLSDRFADHGLVSYIAAEIQGRTLRITDWLMSCRVFARTAECLMINALVRRARERALDALVATHVPTAKNGVMADIFPKLGFRPAGVAGDWQLDIDGFVAPPNFIDCCEGEA